MSLPLNASAVLVVTSPVKSVLCPSVFIKNLGRLAINDGIAVKPDPASSIVIPVMIPPLTLAVPNAPEPDVSPGAGITLTDTKL